MEFGILKQSQTESLLDQFAQVRPRSNNKWSATRLAAPLMLTSLVDAFAVIVIYLLVSTQQSHQDLKIDSQISLPKASYSNSLDSGVNVRIVNGAYIINDTSLRENEIGPFLLDLSSKLKQSRDQRQGNLIILADQKSSFSRINPLLAIAAQAGFENIRFAVIGEQK
ncbi:MAG: biopolymer transporter ExbD [Bdellovibrionales bacterium]|nr:biopolymer transporter ExbD [Bdellovibrionales bacterium]